MSGLKNGFQVISGKRVRVRFRLNGVLHKKTLPSIDAAKAWRRSIEDRHLLTQMGLITRPTGSGVTLHSLLAQYAEGLKREGRPANTLRDVGTAIRNIRAFFTRDFPAEQLSSQMVREFWAWRLKTRLGPRPTKGARIHKDLVYLRAACRQFEVPIGWKVERDRLKKIPRQSRRILNPGELAAFLSAMPEESPERAYCEFIARTGCRPGEAAALRWEVVDLAKGEVRLHQSKTGHTHLRRLSPKLVRRLTVWKASRHCVPNVKGYVFSLRGRPLRYGSLRRRILGACRSAGILPPIQGPATLRHSFIAALVYHLDIPKDLVQRIIGHASVTTTEIYLRSFRPGEEPGVVSAMDGLF